MARILICSEQDLPSVNMRDCLFGMMDWEDMGNDGTNSYRSSGDTVIMTIPELHIRAESIDKDAENFGISVDDVIFMSRHKAASAIPTLTVHPIGNYNNADFGGRPGTLVKASPELMTDALRRIAAKDTGKYQVSFEVTHHGPYLEHPTFFIEIGSDETTWGDRHAAQILADVLVAIDKNDHPCAVGMGGGHYAPRFTEIARSFEINFGHMIPNYAFAESDDDGILRMVSAASEATGSKMIYLHRKSMKRSDASGLTDVLSSAGFEMITSKDLDPISGNR